MIFVTNTYFRRAILVLAAFFLSENARFCKGFTGNPSQPPQQTWNVRFRRTSLVDTHRKVKDLHSGEPNAILHSTNADSTSDLSSNDRLRGVLVLMTVPVAWGTFEVAVRYVYAIEPQIPAFLFSLLYYTVAVTMLLSLSLVLESGRSDVREKQETKMKNSEEKLLESIDIDFYGDGWRAEREKDQWPIRGGMELGTYLFVGNLLQVVGLQSVNSDRAAFLLQLTTVFVPLLQAIVDRSLRTVGVRIWGACALALIGVGIMGLDDAERLDFALQSISNQFQWSPGDSLIVLAAVAYTFHCIRLEGYAKSTSAVKLATCKAITEMTLSGMAAVAVISHAYQSTIDTASIDPGFSSFLAKSGQECIDFLFSFKSSFMSGNMTPSIFIPAILATIWTGLVPVAYTILAQSYGQSRVRPVTANLIYTIQPICTAIFAYLLLQETLGLAGFFGGTLIGAAVLLVVLDYSSAKGGS